MPISSQPFIMAEIEGEIEPDIVAETDLIEVRRKIQEAEADLATARALGAEAYTAALAHLTTLQTKENIILQQQGDTQRPKSCLSCPLWS